MVTINQLQTLGLVNNKNVYSHSTSYGWNYGIYIGKDKCYAYRYHTNGHVDTKRSKSEVFCTSDLLKRLDDADLKALELCLTGTSERAEGLFQRLFHVGVHSA